MKPTDPDAVTVADLGDRATVTVEIAARVLGIGRSAAYEAAKRGELPTIRLGRRLVVPVPRLLDLLGARRDPMREREPLTHGRNV